MPAVRVKICGVTTPDDIHAAVVAGADALGINCYPHSPRFVPPALVPRLLASVPALVDVVGVFAECTWTEAAALAWQLGIGTVQLHAYQHTPADIRPLRSVPAFRVCEASDLHTITAYLDQCRLAGWCPAAVLLDAHAPGLFGGTGQTLPWELVAGFAPGVPIILAGGLTPQNVARAVAVVQPFAVDVASGVESAPGRKDPERMRAFVAAAKSVPVGPAHR